MKKLSLIKKTVALTFVMVLAISLSYGQSWVKAYSSGYYYHTDPGSVFTWSGTSRDGYCDGYGVIQWYDSLGNPISKYVGYLSYGKNQGYGTQYYSNGDIYYQGNWENDEIKDFASFTALGNVVGNFLMNKVFEGGINLHTDIIELINSTNGDNELKVRVTFNGDVVKTNFYAFTLVINGEAPYIHFENINDMAGIYMLYRLGVIINETNDYVNSLKTQ